MNVLDRFLQYVDRCMPYECWEWHGSLNRCGYGQFWLNEKPTYTHRWLYQYLFGAITKGLQCHHICENRSCVNPFHLELVTPHDHSVNLSPNNIVYQNVRKTHCINGHELKGDNIRMYDNTERVCKQCHREYLRQWRKNKL